MIAQYQGGQDPPEGSCPLSRWPICAPPSSASWWASSPAPAATWPPTSPTTPGEMFSKEEDVRPRRPGGRGLLRGGQQRRHRRHPDPHPDPGRPRQRHHRRAALRSDHPRPGPGLRPVHLRASNITYPFIMRPVHRQPGLCASSVMLGAKHFARVTLTPKSILCACVLNLEHHRLLCRPGQYPGCGYAMLVVRRWWAIS